MRQNLNHVSQAMFEGLETRRFYSVTPIVTPKIPTLPPLVTNIAAASAAPKTTTVNVRGFTLSSADPLLKAKVDFIAGAEGAGASSAAIGRGLTLIDQGKAAEASRVVVADGLHLPAEALKTGLDSKGLANFAANMALVGSQNKLSDPTTWTNVLNRGSDAVLTQNLRENLNIPASVEMGKSFKDVLNAVTDLQEVGADITKPGPYAAYDKYTSKQGTLDDFLSGAGLAKVGGAAGASRFSGSFGTTLSDKDSGSSSSSDPSKSGGTTTDTTTPPASDLNGGGAGGGNGAANAGSTSTSTTATPAAPGAPSGSGTGGSGSSGTGNSGTTGSGTGGSGSTGGGSTSTNTAGSGTTPGNSSANTGSTTSNNPGSTTTNASNNTTSSTNSGTTTSGTSGTGSTDSGGQDTTTQSGPTGHGAVVDTYSYTDGNGNAVTVSDDDTGGTTTRTKYGDGSTDTVYSSSTGGWHETEQDSDGKTTVQRQSTSDGGYDETTWDKDGNPTTTHYDSHGNAAGSYSYDSQEDGAPLATLAQLGITRPMVFNAKPGAGPESPVGGPDDDGYASGGGVIVDKKTQLLGGDRFSNEPIAHATGGLASTTVPASQGAQPETPAGGGDTDSGANDGTPAAPNGPSVK